MIKDIPSAEEFEDVGLSCINDAWEVAIEYIIELEEWFEYAEKADDEMAEAFWKSAKSKLARAQATLQQGVEFLIKARIVDVSPFLLILNTPNQFPKSSEKQDISFADFRTIDAQDLIKVHDTFSASKFDNNFKSEFEKLRRFRNSTMHTVDKKAEVEAIEIISKVLSMYKFFYPRKSWMEQRKQQLSFAPVAELNSSDYANPKTIKEFSKVVELLSAADMKTILEINKKTRWYICPECHHETADWEIWPKTAQLFPNSSKSKFIKCHFCCGKYEVVRKKCQGDDCKGNVLSLEHDMCLSCGCDGDGS